MNCPHSHDHQSIDNSTTYNKSFIIAITANSLFVIAQIFFAYWTNSTGLLADAIHNLGDVLSLVLAWIANRLLQRLPTERSTYGMKKTTILASLANGILLIFSCGVIVTEAMYQFFTPTAVHAIGVIVVAGIGILVNGATAILFISGTKDLNIRGAFLHLMYDALISLGVLVSAGLLYWTGWLWLDPLMGLLIAIIILRGTWFLFADSFRLIIDGVPRNISMIRVREILETIDGVHGVHDLHVWALSTQQNALSVHLWMPELTLTDEVREAVSQQLKQECNIHHTTFQVERTLQHCKDACLSHL